MLENQRVSRAFPTTERTHQAAVTAEIRAIASAIRRIGRGRGASPEAILIEKCDAAERLFALASRLEATR